MTGRRAVAGLCMLCALIFSAIAAQSAMAANGTTAVTCKKKGEKGGAGFSKAHCKPADAVASNAEYEHLKIAQDTTTEITATNANTSDDTTQASPMYLHTVISGVEFELKATGAHGTGTMTNKLEGSDHYAHAEAVITFTGVTVVTPAGKGCKAKTGEIKLHTITATTLGVGNGMKITPKEGSTFTEFEIEGCAIAALNGLYKVTGSVIGTPDGATTVFERGTTTPTKTGTTGQETLKFRGQNMGISGKLTITGRDPEIKEDPTTPLSVTEGSTVTAM